MSYGDDRRDVGTERAAAEAAKSDQRNLWPEVRARAAMLRQLRERNHFSAMIMEAIRGGEEA